VLDSFILAWEQADRASLERRLGPPAKFSVAGDQSRREKGVISMGYHFTERGVEQKDKENIKVPTDFVTGAGIPCGHALIEFVRNTKSNFPESLQIPFLINNSNLQDLLDIAAMCTKHD
jgi:hypothetical protein